MVLLNFNNILPFTKCALAHLLGRRLILLLIYISITNIFSQKPGQSIKAVSVAFGGKIQLQKEGERVWKKITRKIRIEDGDLLKSGYKSYLIIRIGSGNQVILGSNSKMLIKLPKIGEEGKETKNISITLFEGGCFVTWKGPEEIQFFSNDGMAATSKASFAFIYQKNNGKTHVISTNNKLMVQNITKKSPVEINKGEYTFVIPENNPIEPAQITIEITDLMKKFFGDKFVNKELEQANIKVSTSTTKAIAEKAESKPKYEENIRLSPLFNMGSILKKIRQSENPGNVNYMEPYWVDEMQNHKYLIEAKFSYLSASPKDQSASYSGVKVRTGVHMGNIKAGINLPYETNNEGVYTMAFEGTTGILDKINYLYYVSPKQTLSIHLGEIRNLTYHQGLLVNNFSNEIRSQIAQPLGFSLRWNPSVFTSWNYFIADLSSLNIMATNFLFENGYTSLGASWIVDFDQSAGLTTGDGVGNFRGEEFLSTKTSSGTGSVWGWDMFVDFNFIQQEDILLFGYAGFSQIFKDGFKSQGRAVQFPGLEMYYNRYKFFLEGQVSIDNVHPEYFNQFYLEDRSRIYTVNGSPMNIAQADRLPPLGNTNGFKTGLEVRFLKNLWVGLSYGQSLFLNAASSTDSRGLSRGSFGNINPKNEIILINENDRELYKKNSNRSMKFRIFGGNNIVSGLKRFEVYYDMTQGKFGRLIIDNAKVFLPDTTIVPFTTIINNRMTIIDTLFDTDDEPDSLQLEFDYNNDYPLLTDTQSESFFFSLNAMFGVKIEYGVFSNANVLAEFRGFSHDFSGNGIFDEGELVSEFALTWRQKF